MYIDPNGWGIQIFERAGGDHVRLYNLLQRLGISVDDDGVRFTYQTRFKYTDKLHQIDRHCPRHCP